MKRTKSFHHRPGMVVLGTLALLGTAAGSGCAEQRDPINRVQANALGKAYFIGEIHDPNDDPEFLWRNYVIDGSASQSLVTVGEWSGVDRIRWEITEELLIGRKAYALTPGADDKGGSEGVADGTIVAAYPIESHFDIRREYNPSTGEEFNVVVENTTDRPWYHREYMRVDWTRNVVENNPLFLTMFFGSVFGDIEVTPVAYAPTDPNDRHAPHFEANYFDVTSKFTVAPAQSSYGQGMPTCIVVGLITGSSSYDCYDQEAIVRSSFLRIDPNDDFEPMELSRAPGDVVGNPVQLNGSLYAGYSNTVEQGWDPRYGFTDALYKRFVHLHNIWEASHQRETRCTSNDDLDRDGTADACRNGVTGYQGSAGAQCDIHVERCTIPYRDRQIRPVAYHVNEEMPDALLDPMDSAGVRQSTGASEAVIEGWSQLLQVSVAYAREVECRRTGGDRDTCHGEFFTGDQRMVAYGGWLIDAPVDETPVLTLCHNPVRAYDLHEVCGPPGYRARMGDIRRNLLGYWPHASRAPYGGIGNWGADPLTGQIHGAAAIIMGRSTTHAAAMQRDIIQVVLGDLSIEGVTNGLPADRYVTRLREGPARRALSSDEIEAR
ncbi:MAG: hypothetical protein AAGA56_08220, partial [Myxococcota bacterium]